LKQVNCNDVDRFRSKSSYDKETRKESAGSKLNTESGHADDAIYYKINVNNFEPMNVVDFCNVMHVNNTRNIIHANIEDKLKINMDSMLKKDMKARIKKKTDKFKLEYDSDESVTLRRNVIDNGKKYSSFKVNQSQNSERLRSKLNREFLVTEESEIVRKRLTPHLNSIDATLDQKSVTCRTNRLDKTANDRIKTEILNELSSIEKTIFKEVQKKPIPIFFKYERTDRC